MRGLLLIFALLTFLSAALAVDRVQIPDPEFGDNQLARWLATDVATQHNNREDPEEDSWDEREEAQDLPMVVLAPGAAAQLHPQHTQKVPHRASAAHAAAHSGSEPLAEHGTHPAHAQQWPTEAEAQGGDADGTNMERAVFVPAGGGQYRQGSQMWWKDEMTYIKVESFVVMIIALLAILALAVTNLIRSVMRTCGTFGNIRAMYGEEQQEEQQAHADTESKDEGSTEDGEGDKPSRTVSIGCFESYHALTVGPPMPRGAAESNDLLFKSFSVAIFTLVFVACMCYTLWQLGAFFHFTETMQTVMKVNITRLDTAQVFIDVFVHLAVALFLLYAVLSLAVMGCLARQKSLREAYYQTLAAPDTAVEPFSSEKARLEEYLARSEAQGCTDYSRYMAVCIDDTITVVSELTATSWAALASFELVLWLLVVYGGCSANLNRAVQIVLGLAGPLLGLALGLWLKYVLEPNKKARQEDCITKSLVCCDSHATWPVVFLQASSMVTCYTIARIVAARKTYHPEAYGAQLGAIMAVLGVFVAAFVCQGLLMWHLTSHCAVTFNLPPYMREKNEKLVAAVNAVPVADPD